MADKKITELTALGVAPDTGDIIAIVDDPGGTPVTKKITVANLLAALDKSAGNLDDYDFDDNEIFGFKGKSVSITGDTTLTMADHNGRVLFVDKATDVTLTYNSLAADANMLIIQKGAGQAIIGGTGTLTHRLSHDRTAGQGSSMTLYCETSTVAYLSGDTTGA